MGHKHKKPTGTTGPTRLGPNGIEFLQVAFPGTKDEIEQFIVASFSREPLPGGLTIRSRHQNRENDLDFAIKTSLGSKFLELMEIAPLEHLRGSYEMAPATYKPFEFAEYIHAKAMKKSNHYASSKTPKIVLLLYVTNWTFTLSESVICLLQYWFCTHPHCFEWVFAYHPTDQHNGIRHLLYPTPTSHWTSFNPESLRENVVHNLSPISWQQVPSGA
jgi:hypothetical protein